ncbi:MAG: hypothetical protein ACTSQJ_15040 [Promethearchaeota archaeon]
MSSKLFPYKMKKNTWYRAEDLTESDIAVIVDTNRDTIWFWEGEKSSARNRSNAREILGQLKKKYIPYRFKRVTKNSPEEVIIKLDELKEQSFTGKIKGIKYELKDFSRIFYIINIVSSLLLLIGMIFLNQALFWKDIKYNSFTHLYVDYGMFIFIINFTSFCLLLSLIFFIISGFFGTILKKKIFSLISTFSACLVFISFFMIRIWDNIIFYLEPANNIIIRKDVLILYILCLDILIAPGIILGFFTGLIGLRTISLVEEDKEVKETEIKK